MIADGYWNLELFYRRLSILFWCFINRLFWSKHNEHRVSREILFSAVILRKIIEDEKEIRALSRKNKMKEPRLETLKAKVPVWRLPYKGEDEPIGYRFVSSDYNYDEADNRTYDLDFVCNKIIHSSIWSVVYENRSINGIAFLSDREKQKESYYICIKDWTNLLLHITTEEAS